MSERMNKEKAKISNEKTIEILDKLVREICEQSLVRPIELEYCNLALDIAIDSLDNEWVDVRDRLPSEDKDYFVTIKSRIDYADRYYIVLAHWEKSTTDKSVKGWWTSIGWNRAEEQHLYDITNDVVAWKKVEPYERKE